MCQYAIVYTFADLSDVVDDRNILLFFHLGMGQHWRYCSEKCNSNFM